MLGNLSRNSRYTPVNAGSIPKIQHQNPTRMLYEKSEPLTQRLKHQTLQRTLALRIELSTLDKRLYIRRLVIIKVKIDEMNEGLRQLDGSANNNGQNGIGQSIIVVSERKQSLLDIFIICSLLEDAGEGTEDTSNRELRSW